MSENLKLNYAFCHPWLSGRVSVSFEPNDEKFLGTSWGYLGDTLGIPWGYLGEILEISGDQITVIYMAHTV